MSSGEKLNFKKSSENGKNTVPGQQNQILKSSLKTQKLSTGNEINLKKLSEVAKDCRSGAVQRSNKTNSQKSSEVAKKLSTGNETKF